MSNGKHSENYLKQNGFTLSMTIETKQILSKLDVIKSEIDYIKEHLIDVDTVLLDEDIEALQEAEEDFKTQKTKRL